MISPDPDFPQDHPIQCHLHGTRFAVRILRMPSNLETLGFDGAPVPDSYIAMLIGRFSREKKVVDSKAAG